MFFSDLCNICFGSTLTCSLLSPGNRKWVHLDPFFQLTLHWVYHNQEILINMKTEYQFHYDNTHLDNLSEDEMAIGDFMALHLEESENPYKDIHKKRIHQSLEVFQRAFNDGLSKVK